jgi:mono/diheme cytochrome c family protein
MKMDSSKSLSSRGSAILVAVVVLLLLSDSGCRSTFLRGTTRIPAQRSARDDRFEPPNQAASPLIARGRMLFLNSCAHCHGLDARGDEGPDLHEVDVSDRRIADVITRGIPHEMPSFARKLGPPDVTALVAYVQSLNSP